MQSNIFPVYYQPWRAWIFDKKHCSTDYTSLQKFEDADPTMQVKQYFIIIPIILKDVVSKDATLTEGQINRYHCVKNLDNVKLKL